MRIENISEILEENRNLKKLINFLEKENEILLNYLLDFQILDLKE